MRSPREEVDHRRSEPLRIEGTLAYQVPVLIGPGNGLDRVIEETVIYARGDTPVFVAGSLSAAVAGPGRVLVPAGGSRLYRGPQGQVVLYVGKSGTTDLTYDLEAEATGRVNADWWADKTWRTTHEFVCLPARTPNAAVVTEFDIAAPCTASYVKTWTKTKRTSAAGTYVMTVQAVGPGGVVRNLLSAANVDLEGLTVATLQSATLTATTANLALVAGEKLRITVTSNNADLGAGDLAVGVGVTLGG